MSWKQPSETICHKEEAEITLHYLACFVLHFWIFERHNDEAHCISIQICYYDNFEKIFHHHKSLQSCFIYFMSNYLFQQKKHPFPLEYFYFLPYSPLNFQFFYRHFSRYCFSFHYFHYFHFYHLNFSFCNLSFFQFHFLFHFQNLKNHYLLLSWCFHY